MAEACELSAVAARRLIGRRALSPVELLESCLARIEAVNPAINAVVALDADAARAAARQAEAAVARGETLGALHGLPVLVKDLEDTAGLRTTYGSTLFRDRVPAADERSVAAVRAAGGVVLGKTNTPEFGAGANTRNAVYGATGNPFDPTRSAAGSSGGSAAALACCMAPLASGSDMGGSLRNPAAFCGIVGMRPSPGLVPSEKALHGWSPLAVQGPMARDVADAGLLLRAMAGYDARSPLASPGFAIEAAPADLTGLRVAFSTDLGIAPVERQVADTFLDRIAALRGVVARLEQASPDCGGTDQAFAVLRGVAFLAAHAERARTAPDHVAPNIHANLAESARYGIADVAAALTAQTALYRRWQSFFADWDVLLTPAITISPRPWRELYPARIDDVPTRSYYHWLALAYAVSLVGHPALALPCGRDAQAMPFGVQIVGPRHGDGRVLAVAAAVEQVFAGDPRSARPVPDIAALRAAPPLRQSEGFLGYD
jgi:Asp-tRNA(Asn)/Glu-tRNA(Gln) amidotransferase A subunit family amidase